ALARVRFKRNFKSWYIRKVVLTVRTFGEMSEWFKEHAWKACVGVTPPWVRIPLSPFKRAAAAKWLWGAAQLEPENPARSGRKQRYWVNQCDAVSPWPLQFFINEISGHRA